VSSLFHSHLAAVWKLKPTDESAAQALAAGLEISTALARVLVPRGVRTAEQARRFLKPGLSDLHPAGDLPGIDRAVGCIRDAIRNREPILVWGHEDLDGVSAVVCLRETIEDLHGITAHYIPAKGKGRHGLDPAKLKEFYGQGIRQVVTVDCGITNLAETIETQKLGMAVIITDHHEVLDELPLATAVVNPKRADARYPFRDLAGVGVALKLALALAREMVGVTPEEFFSAKPEMLTLAALGSIADRVALVDENRVLVRHGLEQMRRSRLAAVQAVLETAGIGPGELTVRRFVYDLLPLFASANGNAGVEMFLNGDREAARKWSQDLWNQYQAWREEARITFERAERFLDLAPGIVFVRSDELSLRALGHCASRLKEQYLLPVCVLGRRDNDWVGECRGVDGVDLVAMLKAHAHYFLDYGGHRKACGFTVPDEKVEAFLNDAKTYAARHFVGRITESSEREADALVGLSEITDDFRALAPSGEGNPEPLLVSLNTPLRRRGAEICSPAAPGLRILEDGAAPGEPGDYDVLYSLDDNLNVRLNKLERVTPAC